MNDRLVWIDCEMTGLDIERDALTEIACVVTDSELNLLDGGIDLIIKPPAEALDQMGDVVRDMHTKSGLLSELANGMPLTDACDATLTYVKHHVPEARKAPLCGNSIATDRWFIARGHARPGQLAALPDDRRLLGQGARAALVPAGLLRLPGEARGAPGPGRHHRVRARAAVLPGRGVRPPAGTRLRRRPEIATRYANQKPGTAK